MTLELTAIPLAWFAGLVGILSPCVWPLVPVVMASSANKDRSGPLFLALGLSLAFAIAGALLTFVLLNAGLSPDALRPVAAVLLVVVGLTLVSKALGDWVSLRLSLLSSRLNIGNPDSTSAAGQFGVGMLLGLVWLPCVGPTLGAAIALASTGQDMAMAFVIMLSFGIGTASALIAAALLSQAALNRLRPGILNNATRAKQVLGILLLALGLLVLTGLDKTLETYALQVIPDWVLTL